MRTASLTGHRSMPLQVVPSSAPDSDLAILLEAAVGHAVQLTGLGRQHQINPIIASLQQLGMTHLHLIKRSLRMSADKGYDDHKLITAGLRFGCARVQALLCALPTFRVLPTGFDNRQLREHLAPLLGVSAADWSAGPMTYDLRRLRDHGLIESIPRSRRYRVTTAGIRTALCYQRTYARVLRPALATVFEPTHPGTRASSALWKRSTARSICSGRAMTWLHNLTHLSTSGRVKKSIASAFGWAWRRAPRISGGDGHMERIGMLFALAAVAAATICRVPSRLRLFTWQFSMTWRRVLRQWRIVYRKTMRGSCNNLFVS